MHACCMSGVRLSTARLYLCCKLDVNKPSETRLARDRWTEEEIREVVKTAALNGGVIQRSFDSLCWIAVSIFKV